MTWQNGQNDWAKIYHYTADVNKQQKKLQATQQCRLLHVVQQQRQLIAVATPRRKIQFSGKQRLLLGHKMQQKLFAKPECGAKGIVYTWLYACLCMYGSVYVYMRVARRNYATKVF